MPRTLVALPQGTDASWLDLLPSSPRPLSPLHRTPHATPQILSRIQALKEFLSEVKLSLNTRIQMSLSHKHQGVYCAHCTPRAVRGACGPTCPLLRPQKTYSPFHDVADGEWYKQLASDKAKYREITDDMAARGTAVYASTVARWERAVARLRKGVEVPTEYWESEGWPYAKFVDQRKRIEFKVGWSFERAWGRGPGLEVEVPPEVRKRKLGDSTDANGDYSRREIFGKRVKRI